MVAHSLSGATRASRSARAKRLAAAWRARSRTTGAGSRPARSALRNAASIAALVLTTETLVVEKKEDEDED